jgi:hypothetical protein
MSDLKHPFVMFPTRIWNLPGITLQLLKFYEKIFQFWHQDHKCFIGNRALMDYAGMKSDSTVRAAFTYFETHGEMKRVMKAGKRYIVQPVKAVETESVDNLHENSATNDHTSAPALGGERHSAGTPSAPALPNNINIIKQNNKKLLSYDEQKKHKAVDKREDWKEANQKKHSWADGKKESPRADVTKQSTSYDPDKHRDTKPFDPDSPGYQAFLDANPRIKRAHEKRKKASQTTELSAGTSVSTEVPSREHTSETRSEHALDGQSYLSPELRNGHRLMAPRSACSYLEASGLASEDNLASA